MLGYESSTTCHQMLGTLNIYVSIIHLFVFYILKDLTIVHCRTTCCCTRTIWKIV